MSRNLLDHYPEPIDVCHISFVPFTAAGECAVIQGASGTLRFPAGAVHPCEHYLDAALRVPLETAGFRMQRFHPLAQDAAHLFAWISGDRYRGHRPHAQVELIIKPPEQIVGLLHGRGQPDDAALVAEAARSLRTQSDDAYYAGNLHMLEHAYLTADTAQGGSGFGRDATAWRLASGVWRASI